MECYKLMRLRKDGTLGSLFINPRAVLPLHEWLVAESFPTKGYALRPGWHVMRTPVAPHLSMKGRIWVRVIVIANELHRCPASQRGEWILSQYMRILEVLPTISPAVITTSTTTPNS